MDSLRPQLHDAKTGKLNAREIAKALGTTPARLSAATRFTYQTLRRAPSAERLQSSLVPIARVVELLDAIYPERTSQHAWLNQPLRDLEGNTPLGVILRGHASVVADLLSDALDGQPT